MVSKKITLENIEAKQLVTALYYNWIPKRIFQESYQTKLLYMKLSK